MLAGLGIKSTAVKPLITYGQMVQFLILIAQVPYLKFIFQSFKRLGVVHIGNRLL